MAVSWPASLNPTDVMWQLESTSRSGGASLTGSEQIVASDAGRWKASVALNLRGKFREEKVLAFRALMSQLSGRAGLVEMPVFDGYRPYTSAGRMMNDDASVGATDAFLEDHAGFGQDSTVYATLAASAALGATQTSFTLAGAAPPRPGNYFTISSSLYLISQAWRDTSAGATFVTFSPRLRAAASSGATVILDKPRCTMRLAADNTGELMLTARRYGQVTVDLVEAF